MGCGGSRLVVHEGERVLPARIRPLLWRRFDEIKRRTNAGLILKEDPTNLSKKELLNKDGGSGSDDDHSLQSRSPHHVDDHRSASSQEDIEKVAPAHDPYEATITPMITTTTKTAPAADLKMERSVESAVVSEKAADLIKPALGKPCQDDILVIEKEEAPMTGSPKMASPQEWKEKRTEQDKKDEDKEREVNAMATGITVAVKEVTAEVIESERDEEERGYSSVQDEEEEEHHESLIYPGSPSFRVYFIESLGNNTDDENGDDAEKTSESDQDSGETINSSVNSNESILESRTPNKKPGKKGRRFRRVIPKGKPVPGAVKKLLSVKSCYYPSCTCHDKARLLAQKEIA